MTIKQNLELMNSMWTTCDDLVKVIHQGEDKDIERRIYDVLWNNLDLMNKLNQDLKYKIDAITTELTQK